jgi:hypothetical protein
MARLRRGTHVHQAGWLRQLTRADQGGSGLRPQGGMVERPDSGLRGRVGGLWHGPNDSSGPLWLREQKRQTGERTGS